MLGYIGETKDKNLKVNELEIEEAKWFKFDEMPIGIPPSTIMSGRLIERAVLTIRNKVI
jgi:NADH pyrophosphatase NudC (nudix superfamily)